ncbi:MAG: hypothetical protein CFH34_01609 [Alphaproteobacteria bacterium MarineAlpha9_Bin4]|nr:hypothetical protein [Pelagibacterales bacterium]PPR25028.1 MAG: hypothetical protein CFH34_01609 [Alphaproteobacteria bacterium MarineAlpha9_Bin4]
MEIFVITRLYSGFENSLSKLIWKPEGVPAIYKLIEKLDKNSNLNLFLMAKDSGKTYTSNWKTKTDQKLKIAGLKNKVNILAGINFFKGTLPKKIAMVARDLRHLLKILYLIKKKKPKLIYCDSSNVVIAYFVSKFFPKIPIVLRVLGVCSFLRSLPTSKRIVHKIYKKAFKAKFAAVIGTQDGSGVEYWFEKVLDKKIERFTILNGVDAGSIKNNLKNKYTMLRKSSINEKIILFVGRLEEYKGINTFLNAVLKLLIVNTKPCKVLIVGDGSLFNEVKNKIDQSKFKKNFILLKNIPHKNILQLHLLSDIYVSTNRDGNLSNANLEAISSNDCMVIPFPNIKEKIDIKTSSLLKDSVIYYENESIDDLESKLQFLLLNPKHITKMKKQIKKIKTRFLKTWDQRIKEELEILKNCETNNK